jgi:hypothetical protein
MEARMVPTIACAARCTALLLLAALVCTAAAHAGGNCAAPPTGFIPLTDLGAGTYQGVIGGLYVAGSNHRPQAHNDSGVSIARAIVPLDTLGHPDPAHGRVVLISIGMSNATQEFSTFVPLAAAWPYRNPRLNVIDCAEGGQSVDRILSPTAPYWDTVLSRLRSHGSAPLQPQAVWIKEAIAGPSGGFAASTDTLTHDLAALVRLIHQKLPNVRLAYFTSRIYAGYATSTLNPEPYAYQSAFAVRNVIQQQLDGVDSLNFDAARGAVQAPWLAWGPYLWADGMNPRSDGLVWPCDDFVTDGTHPATAGRQLVADSLLRFFSRDETTVPWFVAGSAGVPRSVPGVSLAVAPNPASSGVTLRVAVPGVPWRVEILDLAGRRVRLVAEGRGTSATLTWDGRCDRGAPVRAGVYLVHLEAPGTRVVKRLVRLPG